MKLFIYEHCPFCIRARMIFGIKKQPIDLEVLMDDDIATPTRMIGRKMVPILQKQDGSYMAESMDIVHYIDRMSSPLVADGQIDPQIQRWCDAVTPISRKLATPRFTRGDFIEIASDSARQAYIARVEKSYGAMDQLIADTPTILQQLAPYLEELADLVAERKQIDINDFLLFPLLFTLTIVRDLTFSDSVKSYLDRLSQTTDIDLLSAKAI